MKDMENSNLIVPENRIVLIDDDPVYNSVLLKYAEMAGVQMDVYESLEQMGTIGALGRYDAAIVDYDLGSLTVSKWENICQYFLITSQWVGELV